MKKLSLIVAMDRNRLIGCKNGLPWRMPADLAFFKRITMGKPVVMGRKTFESIGKPLPGRRNIVVSRDPDYRAPGTESVTDLESALELCSETEEVMLIGGSSLYSQTLESATGLYLTRIDHEFEGDTWFPDFDTHAWQLEWCELFPADGNNPFPYSFEKYVRVMSPELGYTRLLAAVDCS